MDLHYIQLEILRELLFNPNSNFSKLNTKEITTDLLAYHLKQLIKLKYIKKDGKKYVLTAIGKEFANRIDTEATSAKIEHQGKVSVVCHVFQGKDFDSPMVVQTRLKEPFFGYKGGVTGKIKYGEKLLDGARREVIEEANLTGDFQYHGMVHHINLKDGDIVEDKYLFAFTVFDAKGELRRKGEGFENEWMLLKNYRKVSPIYDGELDIIDMCILGKDHFIEVVNELDEF